MPNETQLPERSRHTIMDGMVVTVATEFTDDDKARGPFEVSASRNAVMVHWATCRTEWEIDALIEALKVAKTRWQKIR